MRTLLAMIALLCASPLMAGLEQELTVHLNQGHLDKVGLLLKKCADKKSLEDLEAIAQKVECSELLSAIATVRKIKNNINGFSLSTGKLLQTSFFIETQLPTLGGGKKCYHDKKKTGLSHTVEYDPKTKAAFIQLTGKKSYIGAGKKKTVHKAIFYDHDNPRIVARAEQSANMKKELKFTKKMQGKPGMFEILGIGAHKKGRKKFTTIYSELYSPGSLRFALDNGYKLSLYEKARAALGILTGLKSMHEAGIAHRDLGDGNYLIKIPSGKRGKREVTACVADLGRAEYITKLKDNLVQARKSYTAPEGLFRKKMKGSTYYGTDVFACGCALYRIFHSGKIAPWHDASYVKDTKTSLSKRYKTLSYRIKKVTKERREKLATMQKSGQLSPKREFEYLILRMLHVDPAKRGSTSELQSKMQEICDRLYQVYSE